ncbi:MAG: TIR domain-containing protein [Leptolyngbyaceae cyanobacterium MO_188.B28]|nr:TIR domain-containing protein [Leptolyngbyaceae cyanobacterium MO_188.B28]
MVNAAIRIFVSYARKDEALREELANHLSILERNQVIVSWDERCIDPGEKIDEQISCNLASAQIILLLVSADFLASDKLWRLGLEQAISRHQMGLARVTPIILRPCDWKENTPFSHLAPLPEGGKPITQWNNQDEAFLDVARGIRQVVRHLQQQPEFLQEACPYQGLEAFTPATAQFFYGRQTTVDKLKQKLTEANFVPLIGASGSGKSSVVRAGLATQLEAQGWRVLAPIKPGVKPMAALQEAFCALFPQTEDWPEVYTLIESEGIERVLNPNPEDLIDAPELPLGNGVRTLLVIDQFEEVFTVCPLEDERKLFIQRITEISHKPNLPLAIVTTMRTDFLESWLSYGPLIQVIQQQTIWLGPLEEQFLIDAIVQPTKKQGYRFGEGLLELILVDVEQEKNCLPLLEFSLTELWEYRDVNQRQLSAAAYCQMGRLMGALNTRAEQIYGALKEKQKDWAKRICLKLVRVGPDMKDTRQRQLKEMLLSLSSQQQEKKLIERVINVLVTGRLLVTIGENSPNNSSGVTTLAPHSYPIGNFEPELQPKANQNDNGAYIDLAHEALMSGWHRFAEWRWQDRDLRRLVQRVEDAEQEWKSKGKDERYLLQRGLLCEIREKWSLLEPEFSPDVYEFYRQSDEKEKQIDLLTQQMQQLNIDLEREVRQRTTQLQIALDFEATLKRITDQVRDSLDESQILQTAVKELTEALNAKGSNMALYDREQGVATISHEYTNYLSSSQGRVSQIEAFQEVYHQLLKGQSFQFCSVFPNPVRGHLAMFACPILDDRDVLGDLWLIHNKDHGFNDIEIRLVQQVANQCAIAIRQARLYQATQMQVQQLESQVNELKHLSKEDV